MNSERSGGQLQTAGTLTEHRIESLSEQNRGRLERLFDQHAEAAGRLAFLLTQDRELADDLVQEAFVRLARRFVHLRDPSAFPFYLRRTIVNLTRSYFRHRTLERGYLRRHPEVERSSEPAASVDERDALGRALLGLSARQRTAIVLRFYEDLSVAQTAEIMGCRTGTVKTLVFRALASLREVIGHE